VNRVGLGRDPENFTALSPLTFLPRTAAIHPDRVAIVHGDAASRIGIFSRARAGIAERARDAGGPARRAQARRRAVKVAVTVTAL
jgi:fatty-acyl-CoA synthase